MTNKRNDKYQYVFDKDTGKWKRILFTDTKEGDTFDEFVATPSNNPDVKGREKLKRERKKEEDRRIAAEKKELAASVKEYDTQRDEYIKNKLGASYSDQDLYIGTLPNPMVMAKGIYRVAYGLRNLFGTTAEKMDEGDLQSTGDEISRVRQNMGAAEAHKRVLLLQLDKQNLIDSGLDVDQQILQIDAQLKSLEDLDDLYKKTYVGERPTGLWNRVGEFFADDLWEGIQDALTYDNMKGYTKRRRRDEVRAEYEKQLREKGVITGDNRQYITPTGIVSSSDRDRELKDTDSFIEQNNAALNELTKEYGRKLKTLEDTKSKWNVSSGYKRMIEAYQNGSLSDPNYIFAEYAQMLGSSLSSTELLIASGVRLGSMVGAGAAAMTGHAYAAPWILNSTELLLTPLDYAGATLENDIERNEKYIGNIEAILKNSEFGGGKETYDRIIEDLKSLAKEAYKNAGLTDKLIEGRLSGSDANKNLLEAAAAGLIKNEDPLFKQALLYANMGLDALLDANNFRTVSDLVLQKTLAWMPGKKWISGKAWTAIDEAAERSVSSSLRREVGETANKTLHSRLSKESGEAISRSEVLDRYKRIYGKEYKNATLSNAIKHGYETGIEAGAATGFGLAGLHVFGAAAATANAAAYMARRNMSPKAQALLAQVEKFGAKKYQAVYDKLLGNSDFAKLAIQYGIKQAKINTLTALSEGAEESAQYIHEKNEAFAKKYGWDGMSLGDMIINDLTVGGEIMNAYLAVLGIGDSPWADDVQFWSNWKGGAMLGFTNQSSLLNAVVRGQETVKQYRVDKVLTNAAIVNRELDDKDRAAYSNIVRLVMANNTPYVLNYLDRMEKEEGRRGDGRIISLQDIEDTRNAVLEISSLANSKALRKELEASGIEYGSDEYVLAIADKYALRKQLLDIQNLRNSGLGQRNLVYSSPEYNKEIDEQVKIVNVLNLAYAQNKKESSTKAGDIAVQKAKEARKKALEIKNSVVPEEYSQYVGLTEEERAYAEMSDEEFNQKLGEVRGNAENVVESSSDAFLREQLMKRSQAINRLTALLNLKAKFNTIEGFFSFIYDNLKLSPMRPDAKTIIENIDSLIQDAKRQLSESDTQYETETDGMSDKEILDYLNSGSLIGVNAHKKVAQEIEQENAVLTAWARVVGDHMTQTGEKYKRRIDAIKEAQETNLKLNWMLSELDSGDAVTRLDKQFKKEAEAAAKKAAKESKQAENVPSFEAPKTRSDGLKSNIKNNKEEFNRRRDAAKQRKIGRRKKYRGGGRLMVQLPFLNVLLDAANELLYAAEVGVYKFSEFLSDLKDIANSNGINIDDYTNDIKQFYIRFRAKASNEIKANLESAPEVIKFFLVQVPPPDPSVRKDGLTLLQKILQQSDNIVHDISSHFDIVYDDGELRRIYVNKEAVRFSGYEESSVMKDVVAKLKAANKTDETFRQQLNELYGKVQNFPIETFVQYRDVDGIEEAIVRHTFGETKQAVKVGKLVRTAVQSIFDGSDLLEALLFFGSAYQLFKDQINSIKQELGGGLTTLSTPDYILYVDDSGKNCAALADIVFTDESGELYIVDVRSTIYPSIRSHYTYVNRKGFTTEDLVKATLHEADEALTQLSGKAAKGLYMLPVVVKMNQRGGFSAESVTVEYDELGKALFKVKDRNNPEISENLDELKQAAEKIVDQINEKIDQYNMSIELAGSYNTKYNPVAKEQFVEQSDAALYDVYIRSLSVKLEQINEALQQLDDNINTNLQTIRQDVLPVLFGNIDENLIDTPEAVENLKNCARELDAVYERLLNSGLLLVKPSTYDEHSLMDAFISAIIDTQVALDIALSNEQSIGYDFTQECTLIAAALQDILKHRENFGKAGIAVQNWWINNFAFGIKNNTTGNISSIGEQESAYFNMLNSWIDTLIYEDPRTDKWVFRPEIIQILDDPRNVDMRRWYSSIIHNGLEKLIDNFKSALLNDLNYDGGFDSRIAFGEFMINQFDLAWGTETDPEIANNPQDLVLRLQNLSVKWRDLYSESEKHSPAYASNPNDARSMATNSIYGLMSMTAGFPDNCKFELEVKSGELWLYVTGPTPNGQLRSVRLPFISSPYPGITPKDARRMNIVNRGNLKFIDKAKELLAYAAKHPEYKVRFDVSANKGSIKYDDINNSHNVLEWLMKDADLYTIRLSKKDGIGILRVTITDNGKLYYVYGGSELRELVGLFDDEFRKLKINTNSGAIVFFRGSLNSKIGVTIEPVKIGQQRAEKIANLILKMASGVKQENGFSIDSMLRLMLYMEDPSGRISSYNNIQSLVLIDGPSVTIGGNQPMNIFSDKASIVSALANLNIATNAEVLNMSIQTADLQCLLTAKQMIANGAKYVDLPIGIRITEDDVIHQNENAANGTTWLGYTLRNGLLQTRAIGEAYKQVNISNLRLETEAEEQQLASAPQVKTSVITDADLDAIFSGLTMQVPEELLVRRTEEADMLTFSENVEAYFKQVFGEDKANFWKVLEEDIIAKLPTGYVVGLCTTDLMKLSRYAPEDAAWHEAFHRVLELLLTQEERKVFYDAYAKGFKVTDERAIAEGLADMFVDFMTKVGMPKGGIFNKIKRFFKTLSLGITVTKKLGIPKTKRLFDFFNDINRGKYRNRTVSEENKRRFETTFNGWLAYTVKNTKTGQKFESEHIANSGELNSIVSSIGYYIAKTLGYDATIPQLINYDDWEFLESSIISGNLGGIVKKKKTNNKSKDSISIDESLIDLIPEDVLSKLRGDGVKEEELTSNLHAFREVLSKENIGAVSLHIANYIGNILGMQGRGRVLKDEQESDRKNDDMGENVDPQNLNIDRFDKASFEFSKLATVSNRVKLFFATIPYQTFDAEGHAVEDLTRNQYGTPTFMPLEEVYSILENDLSDIKSIDDLINKMKKLRVHSPMHRAVFLKLFKLIYGEDGKDYIYTYDEFGNKICKDYDREQFAIEIVSALSSQKIDFIIAKSDAISSDFGKDVKIISSSLERDSRSISKQWSQILASGQSQVFATSKDREGNLLFKDRKKHAKGDEVFSLVIKFFSDVRTALTLVNGIVNINGVDYNKDSIDGIAAIKAELVRKLHQMGVIISDKAFDHMLLNGFGDMGANGLLNCLNGIGGTEKIKAYSIDSFILLLNNVVDQNGNIREDTITKDFPQNAFIKQLANWQGVYNRITVQNMALGLNGKQLFSISQNSSISHMIDAMNSGDLSNEVIKTLTKFNYNISGGNIPIGSIILKAIKNKDTDIVGKIRAHTYIGMKTDNFGDNGSEYTDSAEIDDYISKLTMLQEGYMLFPTLADKGTWVVLSGIKIPGMRLISQRKEGKLQSVKCENPVLVTFVGGKPYIMPSDDVIDLMIEYAKTEREAIIQCMEDLKHMPEEAKIKNYHTINKNTPKDANGKPKFVVEPNGTRFLQLTKVYIEENGKLVGKNLNDPKQSSKQMLSDADKYFFSKTPEQQRRIMGLTLAVLAEHEIQKALDLGLVERYDLLKSWKDANGNDVKIDFKASEKVLWNLRSSHLNRMQIDAITSELLKLIPDKDPNVGTWANIPQATRNTEKLAKWEMVNGLSVAAILADATYRHIISSLEILRCFAGHPGMFKVEYTETGIKNSTADIQKRLGGLVSTGEDNILNIPGIPDTYTCAELKDYEIASKSNVASDLKDMFVTAQVRNVYGILTKDWKNAYNMSKEEILEAVKNNEDHLKKIEKAISDGLNFAAMFDGGINVADGAAYITDTMCENLLRMRGAYNNKVKEAFDILRSKDLAYDWVKSKYAYQVIYDAVNLVTTKYTAYGFRDHAVNDLEYSQISVPYYNKYALFPLFKCIASGKIGGIYQKMLDEDVDMLMMTSAVKVGSCGATEFDGDQITKPFNKYEQRFEYLRRQLNTDPEEGDEITMGTQMIKICLLNLIGERSYVDSRTGRTITGDEILEDMMGAINNLSRIGEGEIIKMFSSDDGRTVDPLKLADYLQEQLSSRNANKVLLDIIRPYTKNGKINLRALSATADASWIESILISTVNKHVIDITTPGSSYVQRSTFAMEAKDGEGLIQSDKNMSANINGGKRLQMLNDDGSMDCVISINFFDDLFKGKEMSFEEKRDFLIKNGIIGGKASIVAYRIPTQAQSSIHALRVADVIPAVKDTIILPEEFTRITGSDRHQCSNVKKFL